MRPDASSQTSPSSDGVARIPRRDTDTDTGAVGSVATLLPPAPPPPPPGHRVVGPAAPPRPEARSMHVAVLAAALVLALAASAGVAVLWSANRKLADEVEVAVARADAAQQESAALRTELEAAPDAETIDALAGRLDGVADWTGLPDGGAAGMPDLQTRLLEVSNGIDSLETNLQDGLGTVRNDLASVRDDVTIGSDAATGGDVDALRREIDGLRAAVDGVRQDVGVLCWALGYRSDVDASC